MTQRAFRQAVEWTLMLVLLAACAQQPEGRPIKSASAPAPPAGGSFPADGTWQCVPYARAVSGIEIYGDAWTWWNQAAGKFRRGQSPERGAVLVFARSAKLHLGHLAVVMEIRGPREIDVTDANWGASAPTRGFIHDEKRITDVSPDNSWRAVRIWNPKADVWGSVYETYGFIFQPRAWGPPRCALPDGSVGVCPTS
jgi:hypothetical protein